MLIESSNIPKNLLKNPQEILCTARQYSIRDVFLLPAVYVATDDKHKYYTIRGAWYTMHYSAAQL